MGRTNTGPGARANPGFPRFLILGELFMRPGTGLARCTNQSQNERAPDAYRHHHDPAADRVAVRSPDSDPAPAAELSDRHLSHLHRAGRPVSPPFHYRDLGASATAGST